MSNMSYCRFQNTVENLKDCQEQLDNSDASAEEHKARKQLIKICHQIASDYEEEPPLKHVLKLTQDGTLRLALQMIPNLTEENQWIVFKALVEKLGSQRRKETHVRKT